MTNVKYTTTTKTKFITAKCKQRCNSSDSLFMEKGKVGKWIAILYVRFIAMRTKMFYRVVVVVVVRRTFNPKWTFSIGFFINVDFIDKVNCCMWRNVYGVLLIDCIFWTLSIWHTRSMEQRDAESTPVIPFDFYSYVYATDVVNSDI